MCHAGASKRHQRDRNLSNVLMEKGMKNIICIVMILTASLPGILNAASKYGNGFLGVKFGDSKEVVTRLFPKGEYDKDGSYKVDNPSRQYQDAGFCFTDDGRLYGIALTFNSTFLRTSGGDDEQKGAAKIVQMLTDKYGKPQTCAENNSGGKTISSYNWEEDGGVEVSLLVWNEEKTSLVILGYTSNQIKTAGNIGLDD